MMNPYDKHLNLPWQVNGTLQTETKERPEETREREYLQGLRSSMQSVQERTPGELGLARLKHTLREEKTSSRRNVRWWRVVAVAASLIVVFETGILVHHRGTTGYVPLGHVSYSGAVLQVTFAPNARAEEIEQLLRQIGAQLIDGPSAAGVYRIRLSDRKDLDRRIDELRSHRNIVEEVNRE